MSDTVENNNENAEKSDYILKSVKTIHGQILSLGDQVVCGKRNVGLGVIYNVAIITEFITRPDNFGVPHTLAILENHWVENINDLIQIDQNFMLNYDNHSDEEKKNQEFYLQRAKDIAARFPMQSKPSRFPTVE